MAGRRGWTHDPADILCHKASCAKSASWKRRRNDCCSRVTVDTRILHSGLGNEHEHNGWCFRNSRDKYPVRSTDWHHRFTRKTDDSKDFRSDHYDRWGCESLSRITDYSSYHCSSAEKQKFSFPPKARDNHPKLFQQLDQSLYCDFRYAGGWPYPLNRRALSRHEFGITSSQRTHLKH